MDSTRSFNAPTYKCLCWFKWIHWKTWYFIRDNPRRSIKKCHTDNTNIHKLSTSSPNIIIKCFQKNKHKWITTIACSCFLSTYFKSQGQTFDYLIIDLKQPPDNILINMHNIYVTLSWLLSLDGLIILKDISIEDICKDKFKKGHQRWQTFFWPKEYQYKWYQNRQRYWNSYGFKYWP